MLDSNTESEQLTLDILWQYLEPYVNWKKLASDFINMSSQHKKIYIGRKS